MTAKRLERLVLLMDLLMDSPRPVSAAEIHTRVAGYPDNPASFKRQFERDKDELREMGVPLSLSEVPGVDPPVLGYRILRNEYALRDPGLAADELEALNLAAAVVGFSGGLGRRAMFKLGGGASGVETRAEVADDPNLVTVFSAVVARRRVALRYRGVDREIDPHRIQFARGRWYLQGYDHLRAGRRWYRLSRVEGTVVPVGELDAFTPPAPGGAALRLDPWALTVDAEPVEVEVWLDPVAAVGARDDLGEAVVLADDDDGLVVRLTVHNREGFRSWLLSFLDRAEVLSPPEVRREVVAWLRRVADGDPAPADDTATPVGEGA